MSIASERKRFREALAGYSLMGIPEVASFLDCSEPVARQMVADEVVPSVKVGKLWKVDPLDVAVYVLASKAGITAEEYWTMHGEATPEHARRLVQRIRKLQPA